PVQRQELARHLFLYRAWAVRVLDDEVTLEEIDHRQVRRRFAVGDRAGVEDEPAVNAVGVGHFPDQPRLAHARLADDGDDLPVASRGAREGLAKRLELDVPPDESPNPSGRRGL